jgi:hypothetical protein
MLLNQVMASPFSSRSVLSHHSSFSDAAVEGIMSSQPIIPKLSQIVSQDKLDVYTSP